MPIVKLQDGREVFYRVRESKRSKRVRLTINPRDGVVMVTPPGVSERILHELAMQWREWIESQLDAFDMDPEEAPSEPSVPATIQLAAVSEQWPVMERFCSGREAQVRMRDRSLVLLRGEDDASANAALRRWLARHARRHLPQLLRDVSEEIGLPYRSVSIRAQRSRWGSCSHRHDISLNQQLLFLPPEWVRHILIHELCHTLELNHSDAFWVHVERFDPNWQQTRKSIRQGWHHVPPWALG